MSPAPGETRKLHFSEAEFAARRERARESLAAEGFDGLLIFRQESSYYLTGFDTYGFILFQCLYLGADGCLALITRPTDKEQALHTSVISDIRVWRDREGATPATELRDMLESLGCRGKRLGIEYEAFGLTGRNAIEVTRALDGFCTLIDASFLISRLRLVKSAAEIAYVRRAAELADAAMAEANRLAVPGAFEGDILAAMMAIAFKGDGDFPGHDYIIGSGPYSLLVRYHAGRRRLDANDQLFLEFGVPYRHYHANMMRTILTGRPSDRQRHMHAACRAALAAGLAALRPGDPIGRVFDAQAAVLDAQGYRENRFNACGYSLGGTFLPSWIDWPMLHHGSPVIAEHDMVFFVIAHIHDAPNHLVMGIAETVLVTKDGCERLSNLATDLVVN